MKGTKEVQSEEKAVATSTSEAAPMDTSDMPKLISSDEDNQWEPTGKRFTSKKPPPTEASRQITSCNISSNI